MRQVRGRERGEERKSEGRGREKGKGEEEKGKGKEVRRKWGERWGIERGRKREGMERVGREGKKEGRGGN